MSDSRATTKDHLRFRMLRLLQDNPEMSQRELAKATGISVGAAHYILNALIEKGFVKLGNFTSANDKRRYAYILTRKGIAEKAATTKRFLARTMKEYEALKVELDTLREELEETSGLDTRIDR